jgi:hypothetical protein
MRRDEMIAIVNSTSRPRGRVTSRAQWPFTHLRHRARRRRIPGLASLGEGGRAGLRPLPHANFRTETEEPLHRFFDGDTMVLEQNMTGTVIGEMLGIPGKSRRVTFGILHVFAFRDGLISREQVWLDSGSLVAPS